MVPGDKSISHRSLIFGAIASGTTSISNILEADDVESTARCLGQLGSRIWKDGTTTFITGVGAKGFPSPASELDCGNSGTTIRLLMGALAGQKGFYAKLAGDDSLSKRPMKRATRPLAQMGAQIDLSKDNFCPLQITGQDLLGIDYELKIASAQIKTAIILAALRAKGPTRIFGATQSRDHTERLLPSFGGILKCSGSEIVVPGRQSLTSSKVQVPGDPSTAAFFMAAAALIIGSSLELVNISLNPTRTGFLDVLERIGAKVHIAETQSSPEPIGTVRISHHKLRNFVIDKDEVPRLVDEIPLLAVLATQCHGTTEIRGAEELRVKESDRIESVAQNLRAMGAVVTTFEDGFKITGPQKLQGASIKTHQDHRIAMAFAIAGLVADGETIIEDAECVAVSYPNFFIDLDRMTNG